MLKSAEKTKIIYKGDTMAGSFYLLIGVITLIGALGVYFFTTRLGLYYLAIGLAILTAYMIGKGSIMIYLYNSRYRYYKNHDRLTDNEIKEEWRYTKWRRLKKKKNRRRYIYSIVLGCVIAFGGIFHQEKGLIVATCIPIVLMGAVEFAVGLLTEFRLTEYLKYLHRLTTSDAPPSNQL